MVNLICRAFFRSVVVVVKLLARLNYTNLLKKEHGIPKCLADAMQNNHNITNGPH